MWAADLIYERCILSVSMDITLPSVFTLGVNRGGRVSAVLSGSRSELLKAEDIFLPCMHATIKVVSHRFSPNERLRKAMA